MSSYTEIGIDRCPVCRRRPSVHWDRSQCGAFVRIACKPLFGAVHMEIERGGASDAWGLAKAMQAWNMKAARVKKALEDPVDEMECWNPEKRRFENGSQKDT